ncbi:eukaryotic initiation factor 2a, putative [Plasmodium berghei]|uniref:Eukaryotic translation initiation factor 2A n=2 Tax=Plasmodium berghei TaxID=5821 RepID=A0A509AFP4_PLABA|nr:eukaryotic translation initiation factor eIF2A, putative [Plasmodium berghei ANKA]CXI17750.1 eukaryotic initiation factor 2a, putative [Plasmodium berghei]SCM19722.1 eukaryotic initiation factor 2a, putative [Plasmodium berghei]SCO59095.1 eukaryotic initiation factor 2a, putative [Plasmodium berghei]VUC54783.1 eukaryotic translation initiation factor eIF2A, putative [Plasmodium berghei ANKA]|eukprot:XP_034420608.1 eukaryotic translation initiation factor eIF2A, putative [Plasmodium berghei ANKA]
MSRSSEANDNLYFLAISKNKVTIYEYNAEFSKSIISDIEEEIKRGEHINSQNDDNIQKGVVNNTNINNITSLKKSSNKFNNDYLINRGINIYREYEGVELATCTHDYKKIIIVRKNDLNVAEIIDIKTNEHVSYIKTKTQIKRIVTSPRDSHIVLHCQYKPDISNKNLYIYKINGKSNKKKKKKKDIKETENPEQNNVSVENFQNEQDEHINNYNNSPKKDEIIYNESLVYEMGLNSYSNSNWPFFKWTESESNCLCLINNQIYIYKDNNFNVVSDKLKLDHIEFFEVSPEQYITESSENNNGNTNKRRIFLATYERGTKGNSSVFKIFNLDNLNKHIYSKKFFNSDEIKLKWNKNGTSLLLQIHTQVDKEKQSYYGSSNLYFIDTVKIKDVNIMTNKGLIYDTIWSYNQNKFYVCKGEIPADIVLHDKNGNIIHSYGKHKFNTLKLNYSEKLLLTGGFGNLSGDISIWNTINKKEITKTKSSCAVICEFFNDDKHFLTATTHPRLRVDNNIKIFKYNGLIVSKLDFDELYNVIILPFNKIKSKPIDSSINPSSELQKYINKQLGIDSKKVGIYKAPGSTAKTSLNGLGIMTRSLKPKSNMPPGCNFVVEEKTNKKKKKKKNPKNKDKKE